MKSGFVCPILQVEMHYRTRTVRLEGRIARRLRRRRQTFQHEVRVQGRLVGEIDVALETAIIDMRDDGRLRNCG